MLFVTIDQSHSPSFCLGHNSVTDRHKTLRRVFKEEAKEISEFTKGVHYSRKDCYMQTAYSSTVNKMCDAQARSR